MLRIRISPEAASVLREACVRAGVRETGGMLFGEHVAEGEFRIVEATVHAVGLIASFIRVITDGFTRLEQFFRRTRFDYTRFNYLGEWHSHPSFALQPSRTDSVTMQALVEEPSTGALFVVLLIVKLEVGQLRAGAWAYFPATAHQTCAVVYEDFFCDGVAEPASRLSRPQRMKKSSGRRRGSRSGASSGCP